jgi:hypothetical protein
VRTCGARAAGKPKAGSRSVPSMSRVRSGAWGKQAAAAGEPPSWRWVRGAEGGVLVGCWWGMRGCGLERARGGLERGEGRGRLTWALIICWPPKTGGSTQRQVRARCQCGGVTRAKASDARGGRGHTRRNAGVLSLGGGGPAGW